MLENRKVFAIVVSRLYSSKCYEIRHTGNRTVCVGKLIQPRMQRSCLPIDMNGSHHGILAMSFLNKRNDLPNLRKLLKLSDSSDVNIIGNEDNRAFNTYYFVLQEGLMKRIY
ncbi:unnamed protein product [Dicrocoelium dendriticum]|nr:unnamed protein product [Dicrocoelium dendriticum]